jgi:predicted transcriptional regulator
MNNLFSGLISSKTRIKLLVRFFFNPKTRSYLRELAKEFNISTNSVREELNQLTKTKLLKSEKNGRQVFYMANESHPLYPELKSMVAKVMGIDQVVDGIVNRLGDLEQAYLLDDYAEGKDTGIIDLLLVGKIDEYHLNDLSRKTERYARRKIRSLVLSRQEYKKLLPKLKKRPRLLIWRAKRTHKGFGVARDDQHCRNREKSDGVQGC